MTPETIKKREDTFFTTLKPNTGVQFTKKNTLDIGGVSIYSIRPPYATYYYAAPTTKKSICLHFTVGYIGSDVGTLAKDNSHVSVPYVVDRCGRIYELFDDRYWSYHLGNGCIGGNSTMSKQSIGIEISNYGPLTVSGNNLIDAYKNVYCTLDDKDKYIEQDYRGYRYFATMSQEQVDAVVALLKHLSEKHEIPMLFRADSEVFGSDKDATGFSGVFYHTNVRKDKYDWPFCPQIQEIIMKCTDKPIDYPIPVIDPEPVSTETTVSEDKTPELKDTPKQATQEVAKPSAPAKAKSTTPAVKPTAKSSSSIIDIVLELVTKLFSR